MKLDSKTRKWIYNVSVAAVPLFVTLGLVNDGVAAQLLNVMAAILGTGSVAMARKFLSED